MADAPAGNPLEQLHGKKIAGLPASSLLIAGAIGIGAAIYLRRRAASSSSGTAAVDPTLADNAAAQAAAQGSAGLGLVATTNPSVTGDPITTRGPQDNNEWEAVALRALVVQGANSYTAAQTLGKYLNGQQLTHDESVLIEAAIRAVGLPPVIPPVAADPIPTPVPPAPPTLGAPGPPGPGPTPPGGRTYTVVSGDTLIGIARKTGVADWHAIYNLNVDQLGPLVGSGTSLRPTHLNPGMILRLP